MTTTVERLRIAARHDESQGRMMNEAADLIEQQQREIEEIKSNNEALKNAVRLCRQTSNARMLSVLSDDELKANASIWRQVNNLFNQSPQTSLAEVRAKQAEESFVAGYDYCWNTLTLAEEKSHAAPTLAEEHANKIRNGKEDE